MSSGLRSNRRQPSRRAQLSAAGIEVEQDRHPAWRRNRDGCGHPSRAYARARVSMVGASPRSSANLAAISWRSRDPSSSRTSACTTGRSRSDSGGETSRRWTSPAAPRRWHAGSRAARNQAPPHARTGRSRPASPAGGHNPAPARPPFNIVLSPPCCPAIGPLASGSGRPAPLQAGRPAMCQPNLAPERHAFRWHHLNASFSSHASL